jgi:hypothetical protein
MVAEALSDWLQRVIQAVKPFYSPDIDKGAKWSNEIDDALEGTRFGIICLTPDNLKSEWIHYEAGALSKTKDASIWTFLLDLKPSDVKQPLGRFQHTLAEKTDVLKMLKSINAKLVEVGGDSLRDNLLEEIFEESWNKLEARLKKAKESIKNQSIGEAAAPTESLRKESDKLDEILEILRSQQRFNVTDERAFLARSEKYGYNSFPKYRFFMDKTKMTNSDEFMSKLVSIFPITSEIDIRGDNTSKNKLSIEVSPRTNVTTNDFAEMLSEVDTEFGTETNSFDYIDIRNSKHTIKIL